MTAAEHLWLFEIVRKGDLDLMGRYAEIDEAYFRAIVSQWRDEVRPKIPPGFTIMVSVGGYDDDPRELWTVPEARAFVGRWAQETKILADPQLDPVSRDFLLAMGADPNLNVTVRTRPR